MSAGKEILKVKAIVAMTSVTGRDPNRYS